MRLPCCPQRDHGRRIMAQPAVRAGRGLQAALPNPSRGDGRTQWPLVVNMKSGRSRY